MTSSFANGGFCSRTTDTTSKYNGPAGVGTTQPPLVPLWPFTESHPPPLQKNVQRPPLNSSQEAREHSLQLHPHRYHNRGYTGFGGGVNSGITYSHSDYPLLVNFTNNVGFGEASEYGRPHPALASRSILNRTKGVNRGENSVRPPSGSNTSAQHSPYNTNPAITSSSAFANMGFGQGDACPPAAQVILTDGDGGSFANGGFFGAHTLGYSAPSLAISMVGPHHQHHQSGNRREALQSLSTRHLGINGISEGRREAAEQPSMVSRVPRGGRRAARWTSSNAEEEMWPDTYMARRYRAITLTQLWGDSDSSDSDNDNPMDSGYPEPQGLTSAQIALLPRMSAHASPSGLFAKCPSCAICHEAFGGNEEGATNAVEEEEIIIRLNCFHLFHQPCIAPWLAHHVTCPTCRGEVVVVPK